MVHYFLKMCFSQVLEKEKRSKRKAKDSEGEESQDEEAADEEGNENSPPRKKQWVFASFPPPPPPPPPLYFFFLVYFVMLKHEAIVLLKEGLQNSNCLAKMCVFQISQKFMNAWFEPCLCYCSIQIQSRLKMILYFED